VPAHLSGVLCGFLAGLLFASLGVLALVQGAKAPPRVLRQVLQHVRLARLVLPLGILAHAAWTLTGLLLGLLYPGPLYTAGALGVGFLPAVASGLWWRGVLKWALLFGILAAGIFGGLLPRLSA
jgi:hypothetical protein